MLFTPAEIEAMSEAQRDLLAELAAAVIMIDGVVSAREKEWLLGELQQAYGQHSTRALDRALTTFHALERAESSREKATATVALIGRAARLFTTRVERFKLLDGITEVAYADGPTERVESSLLGMLADQLRGYGRRAELEQLLLDPSNDAYHEAFKAGQLEARLSDGSTTLHVLATRDHADGLRGLIALGAAVEAEDGAGLPPLLRACHGASVEAAAALLAGGARTDHAGPDGRAALHVAVECAQPEIVDMLLRAGADVSATDRLGLTALHLACTHGLPSIGERLLDAGADPSARSHRGDTPLHIAAALGRKAMIAALLRRAPEQALINVEGKRWQEVVSVVPRIGTLPLSAKAAELTSTIPATPPAPGDALRAYHRQELSQLRLLFALASGRYTVLRTEEGPVVTPDGQRARFAFTSESGAAQFVRDNDFARHASAAPATAVDVFAKDIGSFGLLVIDAHDTPNTVHYVDRGIRRLARLSRAAELDARLAEGRPFGRSEVQLLASLDEVYIPVWSVPPTTDVPGRVFRGEGRDLRRLAVATSEGLCLHVVCTHELALARFQEASGLSEAVASASVVTPDEATHSLLGVDGLILNPFGPGPARLLSLEAARQVHLAARG